MQGLLTDKYDNIVVKVRRDDFLNFPINMSHWTVFILFCLRDLSSGTQTLTISGMAPRRRFIASNFIVQEQEEPPAFWGFSYTNS